MAKRPPTISIKNLSKAVDRAVKVASEKHGVQLSPEFHLGPGTIMGRRLPPDIELKQAEQIASEITKQVTSSERAALGGVRCSRRCLPEGGLSSAAFGRLSQPGSWNSRNRIHR